MGFLCVASPDFYVSVRSARFRWLGATALVVKEARAALPGPLVVVARIRVQVFRATTRTLAPTTPAVRVGPVSLSITTGRVTTKASAQSQISV